MFRSFFFVLILAMSGCTSRALQLKGEYSLGPDQKLLAVPFLAQTDFHCASAALAMSAEFIGKSAPMDELSKMLFSPNSKGTFQNDVIAATRRLGLIALPINNIVRLLNEIKNGYPIIIFQNLGLSWIPKWHYALAIGYDLNSSEIILHSGTIKNFRMNLSTFERTWNRVDNWGYLLIKPGMLPDGVTENEMVKATAGLEMAEHPNLAQLSYEQILQKWPESAGALVGLGNIYYLKKVLNKAQELLKKATAFHPHLSVAWYNYAVVLNALKRLTDARLAAKKAIELADAPTAITYRKNLKSLID